MENLRLDDFTGYKFLSGVKHSPDGQYACFAVHQANLEENDYDSNLWLYDKQQNRHFQLTAFDKEKSFIWLVDSEHILFSGMRNPKDRERRKKGEEFTIFYQINIHGGEAKEAFRVPLQVNQIRQLDEDRFLLTAGYDPQRPSLAELSDAEKAQALKDLKAEKDYEVLEEIPFWSNGRGFVSGKRNRLYLFERQAGTCQALTGETLQVYQAQLNEEKTKAIVVGQDYQGKAKQTNALYLVDLVDKSVEQLTPDDEFSYSSPHFVHDGQLICQIKDTKRYGMSENPRFYLIDLPSLEKRLLTPDFDSGTWSSVGSDCRLGGGEPVQLDGEYLYFVTTEGDSSYLNRIDFAGNIEKLTAQNGSVDAYSVCEGEVILIAMRGLALQELYRLDQGQEVGLTSFNTWVGETKKLSTPRPLSIQIAPDVTIDGWVILPVDFAENMKYPAILDIHGGPKTAFGSVFFHEMQYWANHGYVVFFCNPRGSDGKGNEFADLRGKYGTIDYDDLMQFTDKVLKEYPQIDPERIGVTGGSYGGFMTNWIIGQTDRFRAAASQRSISNWVSMGFTADIGYFFVEDQIGATPWSDLDKIWEQSPLKYADRVKTPTLFIHSEEDYRCWLVEALQLFTALKYHGVESRLCMFRGENHELSRGGKPKHRIRRLTEITEWFDRFLK